MSQDSQIAQTERALTKRELPRLRFQYGKDERLAFPAHLGDGTLDEGGAGVVVGDPDGAVMAGV
ncbi:hypothetical protein, partial [Paratractidigestivibacter faecalis]|uniref:hypothetical protein n=1 Tax=Paratractidigestivibacter faecalis TaxID=2292441 RepID=UPI003A9553DF